MTEAREKVDGCHNCGYADVKADRNGRFIMRRESVACTAPDPERPVLPISVSNFAFNWPPRRTMVYRGMGAGCPLWKGRE